MKRRQKALAKIQIEIRDIFNPALAIGMTSAERRQALGHSPNQKIHDR